MHHGLPIGCFAVVDNARTAIERQHALPTTEPGGQLAAELACSASPRRGAQLLTPTSFRYHLV